MWTADAIVKCHCCDGGRSTTTRPAGQIAARTHWPSRGESDIFVFRPRSTPFSCSDNLSLACSRYIYQRRGAHSSVALRPTPLLLLNVPCPLLRAHIHPSPAVLTSPLCSLFLRLATPVFIVCYAFCRSSSYSTVVFASTVAPCSSNGYARCSIYCVALDRNWARVHKLKISNDKIIR